MRGQDVESVVIAAKKSGRWNEWAPLGHSLEALCAKLGIPMTDRQARKFKRGRGAAATLLHGIVMKQVQS